MPQIRRILPPALIHYTSLFGGLPRGAGGQEYSRFCLELSRGPRGGGEADPGIVRLVIGEAPMFGVYSWEMVLLHELFHLWSAESFRYASQAEQWFNEGLAELYMLKTAARMGLVPADQVPAFAALLAGFYASATDLGRLSLRQAGDSGRKAGHYALVYDGGFVALLVLDYQIRRRSAGRQSLDPLLRWLHANCDAQRRRYGMSDLLRGLSEVGAGDFGDYFGRHIDGPAPIPVASYFDLVGLSLALARQEALKPRPSPLPDSTLAASLGVLRRPDP